MERPRVSIIMIEYFAPEYEKKTIGSVIKNTPRYPYVLIPFDNTKTDWELSKVWNHTISKTSSDYICLLNNDVHVTSWWLNDMMDILLRDKKIGAIGPSTNYCGTNQKTLIKQLPWSVEREEGEGKINKTGMFFKRNWKEVYAPCEISGFCYLFPKRVWEKIGGFNEAFKHYGQESEFNYWIRYLGYKTVWAHGVYVHHYGGVSFRRSVKSGRREEELEKRMARELFLAFTRGKRRKERLLQLRGESSPNKVLS